MDFNDQIDTLISIIAHPLVLMVLGLAAHFVKALAEVMKNAPDKKVTFRSYYLQNPWHTILALIGAFVGYALLIGTVDIEQVSQLDKTGAAANAIRINAFFIGYMADSMIDVLGQRSTVTKKPEGGGP